MFKRILVCVAVLAACNAAAAPLSDADAKKLAMEMSDLLTEARDRLNKMIKAGNPAGYETLVRAPVQTRLHAWPDRNLDGRAIFPYFSCKEAAVAFVQYGDAWALRSENKSMDKAWRDKKGRQFRDSQEACSAAIRNPDMSLKEVE